MKTYTTATTIGGRMSNEDRFIAEVIPGGLLLAIADGHSGPDCAEYISRNLVRHFISSKEHMAGTFERLVKATERYESGSTLSVVHITDQHVTVGVLGDSPVLVWRDKGIWVAPDHNARSNYAERSEAILRGAMYAGGYIQNPINGSGLQMTRALGDIALSPILNRNPEVFGFTFSEVAWILVASDGVFDPTHDTDGVAHITGLVRTGADAKRIVADAANRKMFDNATAILWRKPNA